MLRYWLMCLAFFVFQVTNVYAQDKVINWYHADFPPGFIQDGPMRGDGYENYLEMLLRDELADYKHVYSTANYSRILEQIRMTNACCVALLRKPEREVFIEYSDPTMIALSNGIFVLSNRVDEFNPFIDEDGFVSIKELFHNSEFRMGVSKGRRYKGGVDEILDHYPDSPKIISRSGNDVLRGLLEMMSTAHHIDYAIGYPHEIEWLEYSEEIASDFTFIPIKEMPQYVISQIGCSKNQWGKEVIRRINKVLGGEYLPEYKRRYQRFLPPEAVRLHEKYIGEVFPVR